MRRLWRPRDSALRHVFDSDLCHRAYRVFYVGTRERQRFVEISSNYSARILRSGEDLSPSRTNYQITKDGGRIDKAKGMDMSSLGSKFSAAFEILMDSRVQIAVALLI